MVFSPEWVRTVSVWVDRCMMSLNLFVLRPFFRLCFFPLALRPFAASPASRIGSLFDFEG
jgi:hypothetical protein